MLCANCHTEFDKSKVRKHKINALRSGYECPGCNAVMVFNDEISITLLSSLTTIVIGAPYAFKVEQPVLSVFAIGLWLVVSGASVFFALRRPKYVKRTLSQ
jgi:hypothetical protein